jgi:hypothetical protein
VEQQVARSGTTTTTVYVDNVEQIATSGSSTTTTTYYYANGQRIALAVMFVPGPDALVGMLGIGKGLGFLGEGFSGFLKRAFGFAEKKAAKGSADLSGLDRVGSGLKNDVSHRAAAWMANAPGKRAFTIVGNDGVTRTLYQVEHSLNGTQGVFEWVVEWSGDRQVITHERFIPGGKVTGVPNQ